MTGKIKFIRTYKWLNSDYADIIYLSGYVRTCPVEELPYTAQKYIITHDKHEQYNRVFNRKETIYIDMYL